MEDRVGFDAIPKSGQTSQTISRGQQRENEAEVELPAEKRAAFTRSIQGCSLKGHRGRKNAADACHFKFDNSSAMHVRPRLFQIGRLDSLGRPCGKCRLEATRTLPIRAIVHVSRRCNCTTSTLLFRLWRNRSRGRLSILVSRLSRDSPNWEQSGTETEQKECCEP